MRMASTFRQRQDSPDVMRSHKSASDSIVFSEFYAQMVAEPWTRLQCTKSTPSRKMQRTSGTGEIPSFYEAVSCWGNQRIDRWNNLQVNPRKHRETHKIPTGLGAPSNGSQAS